MPELAFVITAYERPLALRTCLSSLVQQTFKNWQAIVADNSADSSQSELRHVDRRIVYFHTRNFTAIQGAMHDHSLYAATELAVKATIAPWLCFPNDDSYYCPWFAERMLGAAKESGVDLLYCDLVAGSAKEHHPMQTKPQRCCIDKTCFIMKREWFRGFSHKPEDYAQADGLMIEDLVARGIKHGRVPQTLVVHN